MPASRRIAQFDGLRAVAFLAVFVHHALHAPMMWVGVDMFFVLSGFLITRGLVVARETLTTRAALGTFFWRRLLRIVPPYFAMVTLIAVIDHVPVHELPWYYTFTSNIRDSLHGPLGGPLSTMWSIAVEEQFYLVWPWLVLFVPKHALLRVFALVVVAGIVTRVALQPYGFDAVYRSMPARMDLLATGALFSLVDRDDPSWFTRHRNHALAIGAAALLVFATLTFALPTFRTTANTRLFASVGYGLVDTGVAMAFLWIRSATGGLVYRALVHPASRYIGTISYMAYLAHAFAIEVAERAHLAVPITTLLALALTLAIASVSWFLMERPILALGHRRKPGPSSPLEYTGAS